MDSSKVYDHLINGVKSNKAVGKIKEELGEALSNELSALWLKARPLFIKEDPNLVIDIEKNPDDKDAQGGFNYKVKKKLQDKEFMELINPNLEKISKLEKKITSNVTNKVKITGDNNTTIVGTTMKDSKISIKNGK